MDPTELKRITSEYFEQLYAKKVDNLSELNKFFEGSELPKLSQE